MRCVDDDQRDQPERVQGERETREPQHRLAPSGPADEPQHDRDREHDEQYRAEDAETHRCKHLFPLRPVPM